ncbi:MAG: acetoacetate decarboxylase family protein [Deltaproteobacteria bacterium]|nr:acetoacetate decarboxylase family protein [Deltaproteobacteria bacterium]
MELPIVVGAARGWFALFRCSADPMRPMLPPPLEPVVLRGGRGVVSVGVIDYEETSIGPFTEAIIGFAARHRPWFNLPVGSMYLERRASDFGYWTQVLATSSDKVRVLEEETWGYPSFASDVRVVLKRSKMRTVVTENGAEIFQFEMKRPGAGLPIHFPYRTYSRLGDEILRTEVSVDAIGHEKQWFTSAKLTMHRHERVESLRALSIDCTNPIEVRWYDSFRGRMDAAGARFKAK